MAPRLKIEDVVLLLYQEACEGAELPELKKTHPNWYWGSHKSYYKALDYLNYISSIDSYNYPYVIKLASKIVRQYIDMFYDLTVISMYTERSYVNEHV